MGNALVSDVTIVGKDLGSGTWSTKDTSPPQGIIFETNFANDVGYSQDNSSFLRPVNFEGNSIEGFDGVNVGGLGNISVVSGEGVSGSNALKYTYDPTTTSDPTLTLGKHLTNDQDTGYNELFIRYNVRFPDSFKSGDGVLSVPFWKWFRLWQNTHPTDFASSTNGWTENRENSYYMVFTWGGSPTFGIHAIGTFGVNDDISDATQRAFGSSGGPRWWQDSYISGNPLPHSSNPGYFSTAFGDITWGAGNGQFTNTPNDWHTVEFRIKLATSKSANDGILEIWFDGVKQINAFPRFDVDGDKTAGDPLTLADVDGIPTAKVGSGMNWISFFDNMSQWNEEFGDPSVDGFIYVNDYVVSTSPIGHTYIAGSYS